MDPHRAAVPVGAAALDVVDPRDLGLLVRSVRQGLAMTQVQAADRLGISQRYLSELERGLPKVFDRRFLRVLSMLGIRLRASVG